MTVKKSITICVFFSAFIIAVNIAVYSPVLTIGEASPAESTELPILLFHQIVRDSDEAVHNGDSICIDYFETLILALSREGYHAVTFDQLTAYTKNTGTLPDKPILLTFDDGYESSILLARPVLERYGMQAAVFVIGVSVGRDTYKDTNVPIIPHFSWEQAVEAKDVLSVQSHTYDMHRIRQLDQQNFRFGVLKNEGERETDYETAFREDIQRSKNEIQNNLGTPVTAFAYPYGLYTEKSEALLKEAGIKATVTTRHGINVIERGNPECLYAMKRITVSGEIDPAQLIESLSAERDSSTARSHFKMPWGRNSYTVMPWPRRRPGTGTSTQRLNLIPMGWCAGSQTRYTI